MRITFVFAYKNTVTHSLLNPDSAPKSSVRRVRVLCFGSFPVSMGGGNGQKSKMAREKNTEKQRAAAKGNLSLSCFIFRISYVLGVNKNCLMKKISLENNRDMC